MDGARRAAHRSAAVVAIGWTVLALVFLDELLAMAAVGVWGWHAPARWLLTPIDVPARRPL